MGTNQESVGQATRRLTSEEFRDIIGRFASGVTVITSLHERNPYGTTASAVTSLSLEPPMLLICMNKESTTGQAVARSGRFAVNILSEDQVDIARRFATRAQDKFKGVLVTSGEWDVPLLAQALATLECRVVEEVTGGTHSVFLAEVERATGRAGTPLAYFRGQFGRLELAQDESAFREIRDRVLHRDITIGEPLNLDDLAQHLNMPRGSVYHALAKLTGEGLVQRDTDGSFLVSPVTLEAVLDSIRARIAIVLGAAALTVGKTSKEQLVELRRLLEATRPTRPDGQPETIDTWLKSRDAFVDYLVGLAGSAALLDALRRANVLAMIISLWSGQAEPDRAELERIHHEYVELVKAYEAGDLEAVNRTYRGLLKFWTELYRQSFEKQQGI